MLGAKTKKERVFFARRAQLAPPKNPFNRRREKTEEFLFYKRIEARQEKTNNLNPETSDSTESSKTKRRSVQRPPQGASARTRRGRSARGGNLWECMGIPRKSMGFIGIPSKIYGNVWESLENPIENVRYN